VFRERTEELRQRIEQRRRVRMQQLQMEKDRILANSRYKPKRSSSEYMVRNSPTIKRRSLSLSPTSMPSSPERSRSLDHIENVSIASSYVSSPPLHQAPPSFPEFESAAVIDEPVSPSEGDAAQFFEQLAEQHENGIKCPLIFMYSQWRLLL